MLDRSTLNKLIEHTPLAVTVIGVVVFVAAAAGGLPLGNPPLSVTNTIWRVTLAVLGVGLVASGILLMRSPLGKSARDQEMLREVGCYGIQIDSPRAMSQIATSEVVITGSYTVRPPEGALRLFTLTTPDGKLIQPQAIVETFDEERNRWSARVRLARPPRYSLFIVATIVGKSGEKLWDYYFKVATDGRDIPLAGPLPPDIVECDRIWVERV